MSFRSARRKWLTRRLAEIPDTDLYDVFGRSYYLRLTIGF